MIYERRYKLYHIKYHYDHNAIFNSIQLKSRNAIKFQNYMEKLLSIY